jgi:hypothetical protein
VKVVIVSATHFELDTKRKQEYFINREIADQHVAEWKVTDWGHVYFDEIQVTEE